MAAGVLPSRVGLADEPEGPGDVQRPEGGRSDQRNVPQPAVRGERVPVRPEPGPERAGVGGSAVPDQPRTGPRQRAGHRVPQYRQAWCFVWRSLECRGSPVRQDPEVQHYQDAADARRLQPVQLEHDRGVPAQLLGARSGGTASFDLSRSAVDHVGAVHQDHGAVRLLNTKNTKTERRTRDRTVRKAGWAGWAGAKDSPALPPFLFGIDSAGL